jgi:large subunit ribosomal protein L31
MLIFLGTYFKSNRDLRRKGAHPMKQGIHPNYKQVKVTCISCGNTFEAGSILDEVRVDTCANCHPFFTGKDRNTKIDGRVDRFNKRYAKK